MLNISPIYANFYRTKSNLITFQGKRESDINELTNFICHEIDKAQVELEFGNINEQDTHVVKASTMPEAKSIILQRVVDFKTKTEDSLYKDAMTGIYNKRAYQKDRVSLLRDAVDNNKTLGLICLDLDKFKSYNDAYGHPAGDEALIVYADVIKRTVGKKGKVYRTGGEEIAVILPDTTYKKTEKIANNVRENLEVYSKKLAKEGKLCRALTVSAGYNTFEPHSELVHPESGAEHREFFEKTFKVLENSADDALYEAKESGRNRVAGAKDMPQKPVQLDMFSDFSQDCY